MSQQQSQASRPRPAFKRPKKKAPDFICSIRYKTPLPELALPPIIIPPPFVFHADEPRGDAINVDMCRYRVSEAEAAHQYSIPDQSRVLLEETGLFDFVDIEERWIKGRGECYRRPLEGMAEADDAVFLVPLEELRQADGRIDIPIPEKREASRPADAAPFLSKSASADVSLPSQDSSAATPKRSLSEAMPAPRTRSELARAIDRTFAPKATSEYRNPYKPDLKLKRAVSLLPATSYPVSMAYCTFDQPTSDRSIMKAMTSPADPSETFVWLYKPTLASGAFEFERDFAVRRNARPDNLLVLYTSPASESAEYSVITSQFNLRRRRGKPSESLRKAKPQLAIERSSE